MELSAWESRIEYSSLQDVGSSSSGGGGWPNITPTPTLSPAHELGPTILDSLHLGIVIAASVVVGLLFVFVYAQLVAILCLGYKLVSYQTIFLFNILFWASLRLTMYSFYYYHCCDLVNNLSPFPNWLLMSSPSVLLYFALALLVHYFGEQLLKVVDRKLETTYLSPSYRKYQCLRYTFIVSWGLSLLIFLAGSVTFSVLINICNHAVNKKKLPMCSSIDSNILVLSIARVALLESLLMIMGIVLGIFIMVIYTTRAGKDIMDARKVSKWQAVVISVLLIILFSSRAIYNMIAVHFRSLVTFGYAKVESSDMADFDRERAGDIIYFAVMLLWEVGPICLIVLFFRVRSPASVKLLQRESMDTLSTDYTTRLLVNTQREDSDSAYYGSNRSSSQVSIPYQHHPGYGSSYQSSAPPSKPPSVMPGTTPPQLFTGSPSVFSNR